MIERLLDPLGRPGFALAFLCGFVALAIGVGLARHRRHSLSSGGWLFATAMLAAAGLTGEIDRFLLIGAGLAAAGAATLRLGARAVPLAVVLTVAAALTAAAGIRTDRPALWLFAAGGTGALMVACVAFGRTSSHRKLALPLLVVAAGGIYSTVPDTEEALVLLAVGLPLAFGGWPRATLALGTGGALVTATVYGWVIASGGMGRPGSVVGAFAAAGLLYAEPLSRLLARCTLLDVVPHSRAGDLVVLGVQVVFALAAARLAGLQPELWRAVVLAVTIAVVGVLANTLGGIWARKSWNCPLRPTRSQPRQRD